MSKIHNDNCNYIDNCNYNDNRSYIYGCNADHGPDSSSRNRGCNTDHGPDNSRSRNRRRRYFQYKKILSVRSNALLAVFLTAAILLLTGCGITTVYVSPEGPSDVFSAADPYTLQFSDPTEEKNAVEGSVGEIFFTAAETRAMSNTMLGNLYIHDGKLLYGTGYDGNGVPYLCRMKFSELKSGMVIRETEILENGVSARYLIYSDDVLYYLRTDMETGETSVVRMPTADAVAAAEKAAAKAAAKTSAAAGSGTAGASSGTTEADTLSLQTYGKADAPETLYRGTCDYLFLRGDRLYFTDADNHLLSMSPDGKNLSQVVADREIFLPYLISDDLLLYQDDRDGESLHLRNLTTGEDRQIASGRVYEYVLTGTELYFSYVEESTGSRSRLSRMNINDAIAGNEIKTERSDRYMGTRFCISGDHINGSNGASVPLSSWNTLSDTQYETGFLSSCQYVSENFEIFFRYNDDGLIEETVFYEPDVMRESSFEAR